MTRFNENIIRRGSVKDLDSYINKYEGQWDHLFLHSCEFNYKTARSGTGSDNFKAEEAENNVLETLETVYVLRC